MMMNEKKARNLLRSNISAPSLGDLTRHSKKSVLHRFWLILAGLSPDYHQLSKINIIEQPSPLPPRGTSLGTNERPFRRTETLVKLGSQRKHLEPMFSLVFICFAMFAMFVLAEAIIAKLFFWCACFKARISKISKKSVRRIKQK